MQFSLIIATYGRFNELARLFESLAGQTYRYFEVLLVDQNEPHVLEPLIRQYETLFPIQLYTVPPQGVSAARNVAIPHAHGDIIAFPDDDCWYAPYTLERIHEYLSAEPHLDGLLVDWTDTPPSAPFNTIVTRPVSRTGAFHNAGTLVQFYRKHAIRNVLFDPVLGPGTGLPYGSGEDTDFLLQVLGAGAKIGKAQELLVFHPKPNLGETLLISKTYAYAQGRMYLLDKHQFSLRFKLANIAYPLVRLLVEGPKAWPYRKAMFVGRLSAFFSNKQ